MANFNVQDYFLSNYSGNLQLSTGHCCFFKEDTEGALFTPFVAQSIPDISAWQVGADIELKTPLKVKTYIEGKFEGSAIDFTAYYLLATYKKIKDLKGKFVTFRVDYGEDNKIAFEIPANLSVYVGETGEDGEPLTMILKVRQAGEVVTYIDDEYVALTAEEIAQ